ncbi:hypothetical protein [Candidatus Nitronereus thalassa]|uniref:Uncharacterized protein n=1 Tax=Candidatus Nitronereus thalassa TaxID=3020898 RepID=A0ABU3K3K1_9BACT|nr:hypothetical protein [Candidatus Nitronereus thalassa]MDT7040964.1 hypothetical protein [Candidatus Nitronereus thalassa]
MNFDPAIAAQQALQRAQADGELGHFEEEITETEETFSSDAGSEAKQAYERLQEIGEQLPDALGFQEFLIYITWQQVTEETISRHFKKGLHLCNQFLKRFGKTLEGSVILNQILDIRESFQGGLGVEESLIPEFDEDAFAGGD